ncbi:hypothetical protein [Polyangium spumosum]|uniref:Uncharacterized protein n=1 Tax=Polyangium spumosum TaxID=889282 RepID=A0A6N7PIB0_9BACT|nr:hypothetical protein [Polyangium spumosum]MRG91718.1 hypothetical protein [Polyangium spumosum]
MKRPSQSVPPPPAAPGLEGAAAALHDATTVLEGAAARLAALRPRQRTSTVTKATPTPTGMPAERDRERDRT